FLNRYAPGMPLPVTPAAMKSLLQYEWPGNVRELENCIARAVTLGDHGVIDVQDLPPAMRTEQPISPEMTPREVSSLSTTGRGQVQGRTLRRGCGQARGDKARAGKMWGIRRAPFYQNLKR